MLDVCWIDNFSLVKTEKTRKVQHLTSCMICVVINLSSVLDVCWMLDGRWMFL